MKCRVTANYLGSPKSGRSRTLYTLDDTHMDALHMAQPAVSNWELKAFKGKYQ